MAVSLAKKGWFYISDDLLPMDPATGEILPFPRMPTTRKSTDRALPRQEVPEVPKAEWTLGRNRIADGPDASRGHGFSALRLYYRREPNALRPG